MRDRVPPVRSKRRPSSQGISMPAPSPDLNVLARWAQAVHEILEIGEGRTQNSGDTNVKVKDLKDPEFLNSTAAFRNSQVVTRDQLDELFKSDKYGWPEALDEIIKKVNDFNADDSITGSVAHKLRGITSEMMAQFKTTAERIETFRDDFETESLRASAAISRASSEHAGGVCKLDGNYYAPREFYMGHMGESESAAQKRGKDAWPTFRADCESEGGEYKPAGSITRTLDEQVSAFENLLTGDRSSASYKQFIETVASDTETWVRFREVMESTLGYACYDTDGNKKTGFTDRLACEGEGHKWLPDEEVANSRAAIDRFETAISGYACVNENWDEISATDKNDCEAQGGTWIDRAAAGVFEQIEVDVKNLDDEVTTNYLRADRVVTGETSEYDLELGALGNVGGMKIIVDSNGARVRLDGDKVEITGDLDVLNPETHKVTLTSDANGELTASWYHMMGRTVIPSVTIAPEDGIFIGYLKYASDQRVTLSGFTLDSEYIDIPQVETRQKTVPGWETEWVYVANGPDASASDFALTAEKVCVPSTNFTFDTSVVTGHTRKEILKRRPKTQVTVEWTVF